MQNAERRFLSLAGCYALLGALAATFLVYAHFAFPPASSTEIPLLPDAVRRSISSHDFSRFLQAARSAALAVLDRMHRTWLFFAVFLAAWFIALIWMLIEGRLRRISFGRREAYWMGWISLSVFSTAVLYGLGTNGIFARRFPRAVTASDVLAFGFMLALPLVAWSRLQRRQEEAVAGMDDSSIPARRATGLLGLEDGISSARLIESPAASQQLPGLQRTNVMNGWIEEPSKAHRSTTMSLHSILHPVTPAKPSLQAAEIPSAVSPLQSGPAAEAYVEPISAAVNEAKTEAKLETPALPAPTPGIHSFREQLASMNRSWQNIEKIGQEIEQWFDQQRRQAIAHLEMHPGMRGEQPARNLVGDFPHEKLAAVDAEWAAIRKAALAISTWFGDTPASPRSS